jgi:hypothetical protein
MCHAQQEAASHQPRKDVELSSCAKAPTGPRLAAFILTY